MARDRRRRSVPTGGSGRFLLRLPPDLHAELTSLARMAGMSLNEYCLRRLRSPERPWALDIDAAGLLRRARAVVGDHVIGAVLHGSAARGDARTSSDVDVLIVVDRSRALSRELYRQWDAAAGDGADEPLDVHFAHLPVEGAVAPGLWCEAAIEGVVIADRDGAITAALLGVRRAIAGGRLVRKNAHGQPYWTVAA